MENIDNITIVAIAYCSICGEAIYIRQDVDFFMGEPAHLDCASSMRDEVRVIPLTPKDIDDIIA